MTKAKTAVQALQLAADIIEVGGWCQGAWRRGQAHCAMSAIFHAVGSSNRTANLLVREAEEIVSDLVCGRGNLTIWNDAPQRRQEHVVAALRQAGAQ